MTYKNRIKFLALALAGCFAATAPALVAASDISLPRYSKDAQLAAFHSAADLDIAGDLSLDDEDPLTEILAINEVDIWARIRSGFAIADLDNPLVSNHINYFSRRPEYFERTTKRGSKYLFHIVQELEKHPGTEYAIAMFFVINATSVQLIPSSVLALRTSMGSASPSDIILPTILATLLSSVIGILLVKIFIKKT